MDEPALSMHARHRKELRDLQSRITQKKKAASKRNRKAVNAECDELERQTTERHATETTGSGGAEALRTAEDPSDGDKGVSHGETDRLDPTLDPALHMSKLDISSPSAQEPDNASATAPAPAQEPAIGSAMAPARKGNRQKARLARRAAEQEAQAAEAAAEAADLPDLREQERIMMEEQCEKYGLREVQIRPDGHCLYSAVADQVTQLGLWPPPLVSPSMSLAVGKNAAPDYRAVRAVAATYMTDNPDPFEPFLEEPLAKYTHKVRDTAEWGGQLELLALARTFGVEIDVLQGDGRVEKIEPLTTSSVEKMWLAYHRHHFGLGEHYNSLRKR
ncbi:MAG: hypothetical protein M1838_006156 [Thelocarpon superellum]|nr:MAG: hypothetical protein M1838_006156 [Thelocarpon superellum]